MRPSAQQNNGKQPVPTGERRLRTWGGVGSVCSSSWRREQKQPEIRSRPGSDKAGPLCKILYTWWTNVAAVTSKWLKIFLKNGFSVYIADRVWTKQSSWVGSVFIYIWCSGSECCKHVNNRPEEFVSVKVRHTWELRWASSQSQRGKTRTFLTSYQLRHKHKLNPPPPIWTTDCKQLFL